MSGTGEINTPFLGLIKPPIGADQDVWGNRWNTNADTLDANASSVHSQIATLQSQVAALQAAPPPHQEDPGSIKWWPTSLAWPPGFLICDGSWYAASTYPLLFNVLNYYWGGNGAGAFAVPDLRGLVLVMMDMGTGRLAGQYGGDRLGGIGGGALAGLAVAHMPPHAHGGATDGQGQHAHNYQTFQTGSGYYIAGNSLLQGQVQGAVTDAQGFHAHNIATDVQGGGAAHSNVQPGALGYFIIKAVNV